jgi:hypothetical protein
MRHQRAEPCSERFLLGFGQVLLVAEKQYFVLQQRAADRLHDGMVKPAAKADAAHFSTDPTSHRVNVEGDTAWSVNRGHGHITPR